MSKYYDKMYRKYDLPSLYLSRYYDDQAMDIVNSVIKNVSVNKKGDVIYHQGILEYIEKQLDIAYTEGIRDSAANFKQSDRLSEEQIGNKYIESIKVIEHMENTEFKSIKDVHND